LLSYFVSLGFSTEKKPHEESSYGGRWSADLNFQFRYPVKHGPILKTGPQGDIRIQETATRLDLNALHQTLIELEPSAYKNIKATHNILLVKMTLLVKNEGIIRPYSDFLKEGDATLFFVSGIHGKEKDFVKNERNAAGSLKKLETQDAAQTKELSGKSQTNQLLQFAPKERITSRLLENLKKRLKTYQDFFHETDREYFASDVDKWSKGEREIVKKFEKKIQETNGFDLLFKGISHPDLEDLLTEANGVGGAALDSEQYFLYHFFSKSEETKKAAEPKSKDKSLSDIGKPKIGWNKHIDDLKERLKIKGETIGYILSLHSKREVCRSCAWSLASDLLHSKWALELSDGSSPVVFLTVSASEKLDGKRPGIEFKTIAGKQNILVKADEIEYPKTLEKPKNAFTSLNGLRSHKDKFDEVCLYLKDQPLHGSGFEFLTALFQGRLKI